MTNTRKLSHSIGENKFDRELMVNSLLEFHELYKTRPIKDNSGGQLAAQLFYSWFIAKTLNPRIIIESGVYKGQGTWVFEKACPNAQLICIDPYPQYNEGYKSDKALYANIDFAQIDWRNVPKDDTLCFFDDHQSSLNRLVTCSQLGFTKIMFEDNYPPGQGDCLSLKKVFESDEDIFIIPRINAKEYLPHILKSYHEMPPIYDLEKNRWGEDWNVHGMNNPLHTTREQEYSKTFLEGMDQYTWINYVEL